MFHLNIPISVRESKFEGHILNYEWSCHLEQKLCSKMVLVSLKPVESQ